MAGKERKGASKKRTATPPAPAVPSPPPPPGAAPPPPGFAPHPPSVAPWPPGAGPPPRSMPFAPWRPGSGSGIPGTQSTLANPWGSYLNFLQQPQCPPMQLFGENSHFVGVANSVNPPSPAAAPYASGTPTGKVSIDIDVDDGVEASTGVEASRGVKKRFWSYDEEVRLASAWLNTSKDPINGNDKKSDSFWGQITEKYNKDSESDRIRDSNQLKVHWSRLSTIINEFNGYWSKVCKLHKSGYSDDQLMDEAQKMFTKKHKKPFAHVHWWRILKNEPKWCTSVAQTDKDKSNTSDIDDKCQSRPIGREAAKAERKGKRKAEQLMDGIVILGDKIAEVAQDRKKEREKATEAQLEVSRMNMKVVEGQKEVKWLQVYNSLLVQDTSKLTDEEKATRVKTLKFIQRKYMVTDEEA